MPRALVGMGHRVNQAYRLRESAKDPRRRPPFQETPGRLASFCQNRVVINMQHMYNW
jgi:hypothetical protein